MKILIVDRVRPGVRALTEAHLAEIKNTAPGAEVVATAEQQEVAMHLQDADVVVGYPATIPSVESGANLKWIHSFSAGMDRVLTPEVRASPLLLSNSSGIHATPIAEHIIGFLLLSTRKFPETFRAQTARIWEKRDDLTELRDKTILIAGVGDIGAEAARLAKCFGAHIIGVVRRRREMPECVDELITEEEMDAALARADFVVITLPYTQATHHRFSRTQFEAMKATAAIINIGRGAIIDEQALIEALNEKKIAGALLDVTEEEPLSSESPLWGMENVIITPHHSGFSEKYMDRAIERFCLNLKAFLEQKPLPNLVDKEAGY